MNIVEHLNVWGGQWALWLGASVLDATILLAVVSMLWLAVHKRAAPQLGYLLFLLVLLKLFVPVEIAVPERFAQWTPAPLRSAALTPLEPAAPSVHQPPGEVLNERLQAESSATWSQTGRSEARIHPREASMMMPGERDPMPAATVTGASDTPAHGRSRLSAWGWMMLAWAVAVAVLLLRLLHVQVRFHNELRNAKPLDVNQLPVDFQELRSRIQIRQHVRVVESDSVPSPAVWGVFRPTLILPAGIVASLSAKQLEWVLLHELAHVRRRDLAVNCFQRLAMIVHFYNPAVWIANRMIDRLREYACDDVASALGGGSQIDSSEAFLRVVGFAARNRQRVQTNLDGALGVFDSETGASCFQRMRRLLDTDRRLRVRLGLGSLCVLLLIAALALLQIRVGRDPVGDQEVVQPDQAGPSEDSEAVADDGNANAGQRFALQILGPDGKPVPRAEVEIRPRSVVTEQQIHQGEFLKKGSYGVFARADADGRLILELPETPNRFSVSIREPGTGIRAVLGGMEFRRKLRGDPIAICRQPGRRPVGGAYCR